MLLVLSVRADGAGWRLTIDDELHQTFSCPRLAEHRGRWLAAKACVAGQDACLEIYDRSGRQLGVWRDEAFEPTKPSALRRAA